MYVNQCQSLFHKDTKNWGFERISYDDKPIQINYYLDLFNKKYVAILFFLTEVVICFSPPFNIIS